MVDDVWWYNINVIAIYTKPSIKLGKALTTMCWNTARSPVWNMYKFDGTPLLIHTNTNDDDVKVLEVEHLIKSLKTKGLPFDSKIFEALSGDQTLHQMEKKQKNKSG